MQTVDIESNFKVRAALKNKREKGRANSVTN